MTYVYRATLSKGGERRQVWVFAKSMNEACDRIETLYCPEATITCIVRESGPKDMCIS